MRLADVNVLVHAFREDAPDHALHRGWIEAMIESDEAFAVSGHVLAGFLRLATHPRIFHPPTPLEHALRFVEALRDQPNAVHIEPGPRHWEIFARLCRDANAKGNLVPDAWLAALALEHGCEFVTMDRDFARFPGLRCVHPVSD